ncbi:hypothetical protein F-liban_126 [Faustovirus]|nr:hypothetical protein F-liban_126 [Faustovirus]
MDIKVVVKEAKIDDLAQLSQEERLSIIEEMIKQANSDARRNIDDGAITTIDLVQIQALNDLIEKETKLQQTQSEQTIPELVIRRVVLLLNYIRDFGFNTSNYTFAPIFVKTNSSGVGASRSYKVVGGDAPISAPPAPTIPTPRTKYSILNELKSNAASSQEIRIMFDEVVYNSDRIGCIPKHYEVAFNGMELMAVGSTRVGDAVYATGAITPSVLASRNYYNLLQTLAYSRFESLDSNQPKLIINDAEDFIKFNQILNALLEGVRCGTTVGNMYKNQTAAIKSMFGNDVFEIETTPTSTSYLKYITNGPIGDAKELSKETLDMIKSLSKVINAGICTTIAPAIASDFNARGLIDYWQTDVKYGDDSKLKEIMDVYAAKMARLKYEADVINKIIHNSNLANTYLNIIEEKLGVDIVDKVQNELRKKPYLSTDSNNILKMLNEKQRNTVLSEYQARERLTKLSHENSCPHVGLKSQLDNEALVNRKRALLDKLSDFFVGGKVSDRSSLIKCKNCSFDIMCPHYRDLIILNTENTNYRDFKLKLSEYIDKKPAKDADARSFDNTTHNYYCKICGELIGEYTALGDFSEPSDIQDEELSGKIWGEIIFNLTRFLSINEFVSVNQLVNSIRNGIYTPIADLERNLARSKTNTADDVKNKTKLFTTIYIFAYFVFLAANNEQITFRNFKPRNPKANVIAEMIAFVIPIILETKNIVIREIQGMTAETIKNKIIEAFKYILVNNRGATIGFLEVDKLAEGFKLLMSDPIYEYAYRLNAIDFKPTVDDSGKIDNAEEVLGLSKLPFGDGSKKKTTREKSNKASKSTPVHLMGHLRIPRFAQPFEKSKISELAVATPKTFNEYAEMLRKYRTEVTARSYLMLVDKLKNLIYTNTVYSAVITEIAGVDQLTAKMNPSHAQFVLKYEPVVTLEEALNSIKWREMTFPFNGKVATTTRSWNRADEGIATIFDETGEYHTWVATKSNAGNIYIMQYGDKIVEKTIKELAGVIESGVMNEGICVDIRCSKCKKTLSECVAEGKTKDDIIRSKLKERELRVDLFRYYENRCPVSNTVHDYKDDQCVKCGATKLMFDLSHKEANDARDDYFDKYKDKFIHDRKSDMKILMESVDITDPEPSDYEKHLKELEKYTQWSQNYKRVLELANEYKLNVNLINNLGHSENIDYTQLGSADYIPDDPEFKYDTRVFRVDGYIMGMFRYYNRLRNNNLSDDMREIKDAIILSGSNIDTKEFPDITGDYFLAKQYFIRNKKPRELLQFLIEQFCDKLLLISGGKYANIKRKFVEWYVNKVFRSEEMLSKPGRFSWSILYGKTRDAVETSVELEDAEEDEEEGTTDDTPDSLFKGLQSFDIEDVGDDEDGVDLVRAEDSDV